MVNELKTVDLFAGCGGMSLGFQNAGFEVIAAYDNWDKAVEIYRRNFTHPVFDRDLSDASAVDEVRSYKPDVIIGGPPCQDFSSAGHMDESLGRANLTLSFANIVVSAKPKAFVMENVPRIRMSDMLKEIKEQFAAAGYGLTEMVLDASKCGVPQQRKRFVLIGHIGANDAFLEEALLNGMSSERMTIFDYFGNSLGFEYYFRVPRSYQRRGIFSIHEPSMTVRGVDRPVPKGYPGHPRDPIPLNDSIRTLTWRERSLIQTFPEDFFFEGAKTHLNQIIGNAVPVKLAEYVALRLKSYLEHQSESR